VNDVTAVSDEGDPSGVLLSSGYKAGPDVFGGPNQELQGGKKKTTLKV